MDITLSLIVFVLLCGPEVLKNKCGKRTQKSGHFKVKEVRELEK